MAGMQHLGACVYLGAGALITYFERNGFAIAITVAAQEHGYPEHLKGNLMSYFFITYLSTHLVGGALARRLGGLYMLRRMTAVWVAISYMESFAPEYISLLTLCRLGMGMSQGFVFPAIHTLLSEMTDKATRGRIVSLVVSSIYLGSAVSMVVSPSIIHHFGPSAQTKAASAAGALWLAMSALIAWPDESARTARLRVEGIDKKAARKGSEAPCSWAADVPWVQMATHPAVLVMMFSSFTFHLVIFVLMSWTPTFMSAVLKEGLRSSGSVKAMPWVLMFIVAVVAGAASDALALGVGIRRARKAVCAAGLLSAVPMLVLTPYASSSTELFCFLALTLMTAGFSRGGWSINHLDIGPAYAGVLQGYAGTMGNLSGVVATAVIGWILSDNVDNVDAWHRIFGLLAVLCVLAAILFLAFAEGDVLFADHAPINGGVTRVFSSASVDMEGARTSMGSETAGVQPLDERSDFSDVNETDMLVAGSPNVSYGASLSSPGHRRNSRGDAEGGDPALGSRRMTGSWSD
jgi:ACS family sodium-dependent inorganic phosphate cotransporter